MSRTRKWTRREGHADGRYFTHNGHIDSDPTKIKKEGAGPHNWGKPGDEVEGNFQIFGKSERRNSNHNHHVHDLEKLDAKINGEFQ